MNGTSLYLTKPCWLYATARYSKAGNLDFHYTPFHFHSIPLLLHLKQFHPILILAYWVFGWFFFHITRQVPQSQETHIPNSSLTAYVVLMVVCLALKFCIQIYWCLCSTPNTMPFFFGFWTSPTVLRWHFLDMFIWNSWHHLTLMLTNFVKLKPSEAQILVLWKSDLLMSWHLGGTLAYHLHRSFYGEFLHHFSKLYLMISRYSFESVVATAWLWCSSK